MQLCVLHRYVEAVDEIERVVARQARKIEVLGEDQGEQHCYRAGNFLRADRCRSRRRQWLEAGHAMRLVPVPHVEQHEHAQHRRERKPRDARLAVWQNDERGKQWACGRSNISAHLEDRLCKSMLAAGGHARDTR
jgi:hypothetical protein